MMSAESVVLRGRRPTRSSVTVATSSKLSTAGNQKVDASPRKQQRREQEEDASSSTCADVRFSVGTATPPPRTAASSSSRVAHGQGSLSLHFERILWIYLGKVDEKLLVRAKRILRDCVDERTTDSVRKGQAVCPRSLRASAAVRLREAIGEKHWANVHAVQRRLTVPQGGGQQQGAPRHHAVPTKGRKAEARAAAVECRRMADAARRGGRRRNRVAAARGRRRCSGDPGAGGGTTDAAAVAAAPTAPPVATAPRYLRKASTEDVHGSTASEVGAGSGASVPAAAAAPTASSVVTVHQYLRKVSTENAHGSAASEVDAVSCDDASITRAVISPEGIENFSEHKSDGGVLRMPMTDGERMDVVVDEDMCAMSNNSQSIERPDFVSSVSNELVEAMVPFDAGLKFTQRDEEKELALLTHDEKLEVAGDLYGLNPQPIETPGFLSPVLYEMKEELNRMPSELKAGLMEAERRCPILVDTEHRLLFLRCESFDPKRAALRLVKYWEKRVELFGSEHAFLPLTCFTPSDDADIQAFSKEFWCNLRTGQDDFGRTIVFFNFSKKDMMYSRVSMLKVFWCYIHRALENGIENKRRGEIVMVINGGFHFSQFDRKLDELVIPSMWEILPTIGVALHICKPPAFFRFLVFPFLKFMIGKRARQRFLIHHGTSEGMLLQLQEYGIPKDMLPNDILV